MKKSECYLYCRLFVTVSCILLDNWFAYLWSFLAHDVGRQITFADDDKGDHGPPREGWGSERRFLVDSSQ